MNVPPDSETISVTLPEVEFPPGLCQFVATPIGNLGDMTLRGLAVLATADVVYAEDTRKTGRLCAHYGFKARLASYHDHNKARQVPRIVSRLQAGERVAVVSDAGTPAVSDPGYSLIRALQDNDLPWTVVPGPSSLLAALLLSGFPTDRFSFLGYAPRKAGPRRRFLESAIQQRGSVIVLESCHRIRKTLEQLAEIKPVQRVALVREITKIHEETLRGTAAELLVQMTGPRLKGELVLVLAGEQD
ncbi:MAG: 16S rRNA (cytidine(1402)-2'-O)-methyltransferase [bacterium]